MREETLNLDATNDPFELATPIGDDDAHVIAQIEPGECALDPSNPPRFVCRLRDGTLALCELRRSENTIGGPNYDAVQIGPPISFALAGEYAVQVLAGNAHARTAPGALHALALAYLAALTQAEKRRKETKPATDNNHAPLPAAHAGA